MKATQPSVYQSVNSRSLPLSKLMVTVPSNQKRIKDHKAGTIRQTAVHRWFVCNVGFLFFKLFRAFVHIALVNHVISANILQPSVDSLHVKNSTVTRCSCLKSVIYMQRRGRRERVTTKKELSHRYVEFKRPTAACKSLRTSLTYKLLQLIVTVEIIL